MSTREAKISDVEQIDGAGVESVNDGKRDCRVRLHRLTYADLHHILEDILAVCGYYDGAPEEVGLEK